MTATVPEAVPQPDTILRYNNVAAFIHWLTAALVLTQVYVGFTFHNMERGPARGEWFEWHKTIGATILVLALVRLAWRLMHKPPPFPVELPRWERLAAVWNHRAFYFLLIALPLTGLAAISAGADQATTALKFGLALPLVPGLSEESGDTFELLHIGLVLLTILLLVIHVAAAVRNQLQRRRVAGRMPPFKAPEGVEVEVDEG